MKYLSLYILCFFISIQAMAQTAWKKAKDKDGIVIYTRTHENKGLTEFKAHISLNASLSCVAAVLTSGSNYPNWVYKVASTQKLNGEIPDQTWNYYTVSMPWPLSNRDGISRTTVKEASSEKVWLEQVAQPKYIAEKKDHVRLLRTDTNWKLEKAVDGKVKVTYQMLADPGGVPNWLVNLFLLDGPMETLNGLRKEVKKEKFKQAKLDWIK
ncbi:MAG: hypothetical protein AAF696_34045 [Bacteroidota bacterium]